MSQSSVLMRVMASGVKVVEQAAEVVRNIMASGDLGIVDKVFVIL